MKKHYKPKPPRTHEKCAKCGKELTEYEIMYGPIHKCQSTIKNIPNDNKSLHGLNGESNESTDR